VKTVRDATAQAAKREPQISAGFTPVRAKGLRHYVAGEKYAEQGGAWYEVDPKVTDGPNGGAVRIQYKVAARAGTAENAGNPFISGYTLPFVWTVVQTELHCDGSSPTVVTYS
jgi:hypothetical protein